MNLLGVKLQRYRQEKGLSQRALQQHVEQRAGRKLPANLIQRIERDNAPKSLPEELFSALAAIVGGAAGELRDLLAECAPDEKRLSVRPHRSFYLAAGHCIWSASLIGAAFDSLLTTLGFSVYTFTDGSGNPQHVTPSAWSKVGRAIDKSKAPPTPHYSVDALCPLSARDVLAALRTDRAHVGAVPAMIASPSEFAHVGTLVDSVLGCSVVLSGRYCDALKEVTGRPLGHKTPHVITTYDLARALLKLTPLPSVPFATELGTVGEYTVERIASHVQALDSKSTLASRSAPSLIHDLPIAELTMSFADLCGTYSVDACIAWEPQASWLVMNTVDTRQRTAIVADLPTTFASNSQRPVHEHWPLHLTYDLVIPRSLATDLKLVQAVQQAIEACSRVETRIAALREDRSDELANRLAFYFGLANARQNADERQKGLARLYQALYGVHYRAHPLPRQVSG